MNDQSRGPGPQERAEVAPVDDVAPVNEVAPLDVDVAPVNEVAPLDVDGVRAVTVGTVLWVIALLALIPFRDDLREDGRLWWLATCAVGVALGLAGLVYVLRRRAAINRDH